MSRPIREWATFEDPEDPTHHWQIDVTFLTSSWQCIYGQGCQGTHTTPTPELVEGCCSYGAHFADAKEQKRVEKASKLLTDEDWQFRSEGRKGGIAEKVDGERITRLIDDACIFLNRPGFEGGPGCSLHRYAARTDQHFMELKPDVCWQLPLRRIYLDTDEDEDDGTTVSLLTEFARVGWGVGEPDDDGFAWWCTEAPEAFTGSQPVYKSLEPEARGMLGDELYEKVAKYLDTRMSLKGDAAPIKHPAQVPVTLSSKPRAKSKG